MIYDDIKGDYNWREAFTFADFKPEDIEFIEAIDAGDNDGPAWVAMGRLKDGRWWFLTAWCDYTGWGCQDGGHSTCVATREDLVRTVLGAEDRLRLGCVIPGEGAP